MPRRIDHFIICVAILRRRAELAKPRLCPHAGSAFIRSEPATAWQYVCEQFSRTAGRHRRRGNTGRRPGRFQLCCSQPGFSRRGEGMSMLAWHSTTRMPMRRASRQMAISAYAP